MNICPSLQSSVQKALRSVVCLALVINCLVPRLSFASVNSAAVTEALTTQSIMVSCFSFASIPMRIVEGFLIEYAFISLSTQAADTTRKSTQEPLLPGVEDIISLDRQSGADKQASGGHSPSPARASETTLFHAVHSPELIVSTQPFLDIVIAPIQGMLLTIYAHSSIAGDAVITKKIYTHKTQLSI